MAFHGTLHISGSEVFPENTIPEDDPNYNNNKLDLAEDWPNAEVTIPDVVWRGTKLREIKPNPAKTKHEYFVPDVAFFRSFVKQHRKRSGRLGASRKHTRPISTTGSRCACGRTTPIANNYLSINRGSRTNPIKIVPKTKTKNGKRCPLRIAELAVPTKRQCFETWRNNSDILPVYMIERLKQRILDQTPVAGISEAINYFQSGRRVSPKKCCFRWLPNMHKSNKTQKLRRMDTRILCIVFAHRIAKRLSIPSNLALNSNLQNVSNIVSSDIAKIMYKPRCRFGRNQRYKGIHKDVSNTITVWITGILGDLSDRLLEEELRVKHEMKAQKEAQLETMLEFNEQFTSIIDTIKDQEIKQSKDLEEEEGPALEFLDAVLYNVLNICDPPQLHYDADSSGSGSCQDIFEEESTAVELLEASDNKEFILSDSGGETEDADIDSHKNFTDSEHFRNEIIDIIINKTQESEDGRSNGSGDDMENGGTLKSKLDTDINIGKHEEVSHNADMEHDINDGNIEEVSSNSDMERDINDGNNEEVSPNADIEHDINDGNIEEVSPNADMEDDINDGNIKKVSSNSDMESDINDENNEEVSPNADMDHDINDGNIEKVSSNSDMKHVINDGNIQEVSSIADMERDINDGNNKEVSPNADMEHDINGGNIEEVLSNADMEHVINDENIDQIDDDPRNLKENDVAYDNLEETRSNVSERLEIYTDDIDDYKNSKKVVFPNTDLVNPDNPVDQINTRTTPEPESHEHKQPRWNSQTNTPNIMFSEPNQDLLSDADESWPNDLSDKPPVKLSEIASKSILFLGNIIERDEKRMTSQEEETDSMMTRIDGAKLQANDIIKQIGIKLPSEKYGTASQSKEPLIKVSMETSSSEPSFPKIVSKIRKENDIGITVPKTSKYQEHQTDSGEIVLKRTKTNTSKYQEHQTDSRESELKLTERKASKYQEEHQNDSGEIELKRTVRNTSKYQEHQTDSGESELKRTESSTDWPDDDKIPRQKIPTLSVDIGWKVHPKTAPSWVTANKWSQDRGEPSDDSIPIQIMPTQVKESDLRKWSKNLQDAFSNLEMWSSWLSAICKESLIIMKQKESTCPGLAQRAAIKWSRLKRNVRKDALLWTKLYQRTKTNLQNLKMKYDKIELSSTKPMSILNRTIFETMLKFEDFCVKLHEMIVAAEYYATCTCVEQH